MKLEAQSEALRDLIGRVEKASGADRELDARLDFAMNRVPIYWGRGDDFGLSTPEYVDAWTDAEWCEAGRTLSSTHPHFTADLNAVIALIERKLPGWSVQLCQNRPAKPGREWSAWLEPPSTANIDKDVDLEAVKDTPALALLLAFLRAYEQEAGS
jgi:hypothetical protein